MERKSMNSYKADFDPETNVYSFPCPHCENMVEVDKNEIACQIFRHGYFFMIVNNNIILTTQMNPHTPKDECDRLFRDGKIIGCGKPFRMVKDETDYFVQICDYI